MKPPIVPLAGLAPQPRPDAWLPPPAVAARIEARMLSFGRSLGLTHLGCGLVVVPPGKQAFPLHSHRHNDELFVILSGQGELQWGGQRHPLREGDVVVCPAGGPETAHAIRNTCSTDLRYLALSSEHSPEICDYPDSGKVGFFDSQPQADGSLQAFHVITRDGQAVDYWDGE